jgi:2-oxoglutarate ferredoxin oxidoreductase subunit gamma
MRLYQDVIMAGFGGQGVILIGTLLARAGMEEGYNVTFIPVYGPEMRGGTANCTVVISDEEIGSPIIRRPRSLIAMNQPSLDKFQPAVQDQGVVIINSSLADASPADTGRLRVVSLPFNDMADKLGNSRMANMVALGVFLKVTGLLTPERAQATLPLVIPAHNARFIPVNAAALAAGYNAV